MIAIILTIIGLVLLGVILGVLLLRYGIKLGTKLTIQAQNGLPLDELMPENLQEHTGD